VYRGDGSLDRSFGGTGIVQTPIGIFGADLLTLAIQPDGDIVKGGSSSSGAFDSFTLTRHIGG
jgi:hypothetical protein